LFKELIELESILEIIEKSSLEVQSLISTKIQSIVEYKNEKLPIYSFVIGNSDQSKPTLGLFAGIHGLERVGSQVLLGFLKSFIIQLNWDQNLRESLKDFRIVSLPIINPVGMKHLKRSNGNGIDLMRNSPVEAVSGSKFKIYRGHRISPKIPWYRGESPDHEMEIESLTLIKFVKDEMLKASVSMGIDFHSGFGLRDRLWFPYAYSSEKFHFFSIVEKAIELYEKTHPHHIYKIEPQSDSYTTHGDLWDFLFLESRKNHPENIFIPWTLEMGSWSWLKKNPLQIFSIDGLFNPKIEHRFERTMRRHYILIHFITRLMQNPKAWT